MQLQRGADKTVTHETVHADIRRVGKPVAVGCEVTNHDTQTYDTPSMPLFWTQNKLVRKQRVNVNALRKYCEQERKNIHVNALLFANDKVVIQKTEDQLQRAIIYVQ